jgi:hypothetical protein
LFFYGDVAVVAGGLEEKAQQDHHLALAALEEQRVSLVDRHRCCFMVDREDSLVPALRLGEKEEALAIPIWPGDLVRMGLTLLQVVADLLILMAALSGRSRNSAVAVVEPVILELARLEE